MTISANKLPTVEVQISKTAKRMVLRYQPLRDEFVLTLPPRCNKARAEKFLQEKQEWMQERLEHLPERVLLQFGNIIPVLGEELEIANGANVSNPRKGKLFILATPKNCEKVTTQVLKARLYYYIEERAEKMAEKINKEISNITLRDTISRWGSCSHTGALSFSWRLVFAPAFVVDYLIAHEVAHLREANHGENFWKLVEELEPKWKKAKIWIKNHGSVLYRYGNVK